MFLRLFLLFTLVPVFELWLLIRVGESIGAINTVALVIITGIVGAWFAREQGFKVMTEFQKNVQSGVMPGELVMEGIMILVGGIMLITPGIATDLFGLSLVMPFTRKPIGMFLRRFLASRVTVVSAQTGSSGFYYSSMPTPKDKDKDKDDDVIDI